MQDLEQYLKEKTYPGRGILLGKTEDGRFGVAAYFIMGRSENSRNRIFVEEGEGIRTQAFDPTKMTDPSLIIYAPVKVHRQGLIVTNGDQTDTIYQGFQEGISFEEALKTRRFEPDAPNYTPRISGWMTSEEEFSYSLSILKSNDGDGASCSRFFYHYEVPKAGEGHLIHTYEEDGNPLPSFQGEPKKVSLNQDIDSFTDLLWNSLNKENKVSLFVRYIDLDTRRFETRIKNCHK